MHLLLLMNAMLDFICMGSPSYEEPGGREKYMSLVGFETPTFDTFEC